MPLSSQCVSLVNLLVYIDAHLHYAQISYRLENSRRDSKYGKPDDADARVDMGYLADKVRENRLS